MRTCPQCGAAEPDEAQWCGKCYLPFTPSPAVQAALTGVVMPGAAGPVPDPMPAATPPPAPVAAPAPLAAPTDAPVGPPTGAPMPPPAGYPTAPMVSPPPPQAAPPDPSMWAPPAGPPVHQAAPLPPAAPDWGAAAPLQRVGWQPPGDAPWMAAPPFGAPGALPSDPVAEGRLLSGRALAIVAIAIGLGGVFQLIGHAISNDSHLNQATVIRYGIVLTLVFYAVVAALILTQLTPKVRLRWGEGSRVVRVVIGLSIGAVGGGVVLGLLSAAEGQLSTDSRAISMMSGGQASHVIATFLLVCAAAPLVEETLFRGLLLESLRHQNLGMAVLVSAIFFAVWHFTPKALLYYTIMGAVFGVLYAKRGLVASMSAHFGFNGVLTIAAVAIVLGPSHAYDIDGVQFTAPSGWSKVPIQTTDDPFAGDGGLKLLLQGPDGSGIGVFAVPSETPFDPATVEQRLGASDLPLPAGSAFDASSLHEITLPTVGTAVEADYTYEANKGELVLFASQGARFVVSFLNGGDAKADADFTKLLDTLQVSPVG
ncbi:MAG TPA: type II CAAX endopeptidase family protein [Mycobacteriales bacterium]|nr:type II CAAX endopeptidase family protein [Mycobacteriales bacterium]